MYPVLSLISQHSLRFHLFFWGHWESTYEFCVLHAVGLFIQFVCCFVYLGASSFVLDSFPMETLFGWDGSFWQRNFSGKMADWVFLLRALRFGKSLFLFFVSKVRFSFWPSNPSARPLTALAGWWGGVGYRCGGPRPGQDSGKRLREDEPPAVQSAAAAETCSLLGRWPRLGAPPAVSQEQRAGALASFVP